MAQKYDIFISYRRKGGVQDARMVDIKLRDMGYNVSFDIDTLGKGKFTDTLRTRLKNCKDFIVIFEPTYYERFYDENGNIQPESVLNEDWCYLELKNALALGKNIIPLIRRDFRFPSNLPKDIKDVAEMNAIEVTEKEFTEIFNNKVPKYLNSKPRFTHRYKTPIIGVLVLMIVGVIAFLVSSMMAEKREAAAMLKAEADAAAQRAVFVADSAAKAASEAGRKSLLDSISAKDAERKVEEERRAKEAAARAAAAATSATAAPANQKKELYWAGNGDETGRILFEKLSGAGLKSGNCSGNGLKVSASSKPVCALQKSGLAKCSYTPQVTITTCSGSTVEKLAVAQVAGSNKSESEAKGKMLENLRNTNFGGWIGTLQGLKK
ncbi:MAG: TIR domain-containing protein [Fibromonadales bacterium]|nr:TIR domain-containing protein [Fibromonadales bacterium]